MSFKKIILAALIMLSFYSAETNAKTVNGNQCTLGLLPLNSEVFNDSKKDAVFSAFEAKGFFVTTLNSPLEIKNVEFVSEATVECTSTYFGIMAVTTVQLFNTTSHHIVSKTQSPATMEMYSCKVDLLTAIEALPDCLIK